MTYDDGNFPEWANIGLPKWPQMLVVGKPVSVEQAKEIIRRTDTFLTGLWRFCGGNNEKWNSWAKDILGISKIIELDEKISAKDGESRVSLWEEMDDLRERIKQKLGWISTEFVSNSWASNAFIFGPHGWCHPDGRIGFTDNIGKWPAVEDVYKDWCVLAKNFPFLQLTATLFDGEQCEERTNPVITFLVENGKVSVHKPEDMMHKFAEFTMSFDRSNECVFSHLHGIISTGKNMSLRSNEQGLPNEWIIEFGKMTKPVIEEEISKLLESRK